MGWWQYQWVVLAGLIGVLVAFTALGFACWRQHQRMKVLAQTLQTLQDRMEMTSGSGMGVGRKVMSMERRLQAAEQKQKEIEITDLQKVSYNEAVRLIGMGADVEDLVNSCGLTRAEANLLKALQSSQVSMQLKHR